MFLEMFVSAALSMTGIADPAERFDNANFAYVQCLFQTVREQDRTLTFAQLQQQLSLACQDERTEFRAAFVAFREASGMSAASARAELERLDQQSIHSVARARLRATGGA